MRRTTTPPRHRRTVALLVLSGPIFLAVSLGPGGFAHAGEPELLDSVRVTTARQLLENLGSHRVIELAPAVYDLSSATDVAGPHLAWEKVHDGEAPVVRDLRGLTLRGPRTGEARIEVGPRYADVLTLRRVRDVVIEGLVLAHADLPALCGAGVLRVEDSWGITVRRSVLQGSGTEGITLHGAHNSTFEEVIVRSTTEGWATVVGSDGVSFKDCRWESVADPHLADPPFTLTDSWGVEIADSELVDDEALDGAWVGRYLEVDGRSSVRLRRSWLVDEVTGERRPLAGVVPPSAEGRLPPGAPYRAPGWTLVRGEEELENRAVTLLLEDGRSIPLTPEVVGGGMGSGGLEPASVQVRSLAAGGPLLVRWQDRPAGMGLYATGYYRILGPEPDGPVLLSGEIPLSGKAGALNATRATFHLGYRDGVLTLREERVTHSGETRPRPLHHPETIGDERYFTAVIETVEVRRWRCLESRLEPVAQTLYYRVQEGDTLEAVSEGLRLSGEERIRRDWIRTAPGGRLPAPGRWLRIEKPLACEPAEGAVEPDLEPRRAAGRLRGEPLPPADVSGQALQELDACGWEPGPAPEWVEWEPGAS